jgi:hypothetical protein
MSSAVAERSPAAARSTAAMSSWSDNVANDAVEFVILLSTIVFFDPPGWALRCDCAFELHLARDT